MNEALKALTEFEIALRAAADKARDAREALQWIAPALPYLDDAPGIAPE